MGGEKGRKLEAVAVMKVRREKNRLGTSAGRYSGSDKYIPKEFDFHLLTESSNVITLRL